MYRFYSENESFSSKQITLKQTDEIHHIKNVLRLKKNTKIAIFNGKDKEGIGVITSIHKNTVDIDIHKIRTINHKMPTLILACAIPKKSKFEFIIEKATELGVDQIYPIKTKRTEFALNGERLNKKIQRYQTVAINAAKQSKRITIPQIHAMTSFKLAMTQLSQHSTIIIPSLSGKPKALNSILNTIKSQNISIYLYLLARKEILPKRNTLLRINLMPSPYH